MLSKKQIALIMALLPFVISISNINPTPMNIPQAGCVREATVNMKAGSVNGVSWKAGTYDLYACGQAAEISNSPVHWCTKIATIDLPPFSDIYSCLES